MPQLCAVRAPQEECAAYSRLHPRDRWRGCMCPLARADAGISSTWWIPWAPLSCPSRRPEHPAGWDRQQEPVPDSSLPVTVISSRMITWPRRLPQAGSRCLLWASLGHHRQTMFINLATVPSETAWLETNWSAHGTDICSVRNSYFVHHQVCNDAYLLKVEDCALVGVVRLPTHK